MLQTELKRINPTIIQGGHSPADRQRHVRKYDCTKHKDLNTCTLAMAHRSECDSKVFCEVSELTCDIRGRSAYLKYTITTVKEQHTHLHISLSILCLNVLQKCYSCTCRFDPVRMSR